MIRGAIRCNQWPKCEFVPIVRPREQWEFMPENATNKRLKKAIGCFDPHRVENTCESGTPDVNCTIGWIEDKYLDHWPVRKGVVRCDHFTIQQRLWARTRIAYRGACWLFLQVGREYLLFRGDVAAEFLGNCDEATLRTKALGVWCPLNDVELRQALLASKPLMEGAAL